MAHLCEADGSRAETIIAARELINVLRPTVAISWYIAFAALALHEHPEWRDRIADEPAGVSAGRAADRFMQEIRRFCPFTPYLGARVRAPFTWKGVRFDPGVLVLLDVYGTNHDPRIWHDPDAFRPERFERWNGDPFSLIPQGGGDVAAGHRCPGEWITMHQLALALHFLTRCMTYDVARGQDLSVDRSRMPAQPRSGFVIENVRATALLDHDAPRRPSMSATRLVPMKEERAPTLLFSHGRAS
jgi:fatty-acid peroxygenase